ncbi:T9SS type B sorting domain-containing protein [uncultured Algibacter sp.]|uniref:T9SS type B sorting domain-containing protein n=1 Tax=uncultured Algibacter sp. TaxID=298659 RepID=UPI002634B8C6|nr:T9SS type B sorting domain-containing protein [uncultured Algibacter sp.]
MAEFIKITLHLNINKLKVLLKYIPFFIVALYSNYALSQEPTDCVNSVIACGNSDISLDVNGSGIREFENSCQSNENNSVWLEVKLVSSGTLGFTLTPNSTDINEDYDFFVFGPNVDCGNVGSTIRCSTTNPIASGSRSNLTGMNSTETDVAEGPGADGNSFVKWLDVLAGETYFIVIDRPIGNSPFSLEWTGTATFSEPPSDESETSGIALNLEKCDDDATPVPDGFVDFNIADNTSTIIGSQTGISVTYHETASDANIGINPLPSPYRNIRNPQTIYARITNDTTGCFELTEFQLKANLGPDFIEPTDFISCDNLDDGDNKNGRVMFDLLSKNDEILDGQTPADFNVSYFTSKSDAENNSGALPNLYYNSIPFNQQIFVRIEDAFNTKCRSITTLNLVINEAPESFDYTLIQCDEDGLADGLAQFNLNEANDLITGGVAERSTKFFTDSAKTNEVNGDSFYSTENPQIIVVEVTNTITGCTNDSELTLDVTATDSNNAYLTFCDDDGIEDGLHEFDLSNANSDILSGLPSGLTIVYYATFSDSVLEQNPLSTTFTNTNPYLQTIYARVENANDCFGISQVFLNVFPLPDIKTEDIIYYCLNEFPNTITIDAAVLNDNPNNYTYNWSTGDNTYETMINAPGTYTVTVTDTNNCSNFRTITVKPSNIASFSATPFNIKDASENNTITVFVTGEGTYQYSLVDENNNTIKPYQESNLFENVFPGIYNVLVRDIKNDCGVVNEIASVIGFPKFFTPNNDGVNDTWQVYGISNSIQSQTKIQIFNRFGKLIKELDPEGEGWNGNLNGIKLPNDDYWFTIKLQDGRVYKNHFALIN